MNDRSARVLASIFLPIESINPNRRLRSERAKTFVSVTSRRVESSFLAFDASTRSANGKFARDLSADMQIPSGVVNKPNN